MLEPRLSGLCREGGFGGGPGGEDGANFGVGGRDGRGRGKARCDGRLAQGGVHVGVGRFGLGGVPGGGGADGGEVAGRVAVVGVPEHDEGLDE
ncbi:hypothetical protein E4P41_20325, partial [Geodermatophilus sp. DF01-2]